MSRHSTSGNANDWHFQSEFQWDNKARLIELNKGISFITSVGFSLKLSQIAIATASTFFHRFYMRLPNAKQKNYDIAAASLYLSTKVSDNSARSFSSIVVYCIRKAAKNDNLKVSEDCKEYLRWRDVIIKHEDLLITTLCFDFEVNLPYTFIVEGMSKFNVKKKIIQTAWSFANDSYRIPLCVLYKPNEIAISVIYLACRLLQEQLKRVRKEDEDKDFWDIVGVDFEVIVEITRHILNLYPTEIFKKCELTRRISD